jgi:hypothetical protein
MEIPLKSIENEEIIGQLKTRFIDKKIAKIELASYEANDYC